MAAGDEERLAIAVPKARPAAGEYPQFARQIKADGRLRAMVTRSGLRVSHRIDRPIAAPALHRHREI